MAIFRKASVLAIAEHISELKRIMPNANVKLDEKSIQELETIDNKLLEDLRKIHNKNISNELIVLAYNLNRELSYAAHVDTNIHRQKESYSNNNSEANKTIYELISTEEMDFLRHLLAISSETIKTKSTLENIQSTIANIEEYEQHVLKKIPQDTPKNIILHPKQLILVHKTSSVPKKGILKATTSFYDYKNKDSLKNEELAYRIGRTTLHFSLNGPIKSFGWFHVNFDKTRYAVLIPFVSVKNRVINLNPDDTIIVGDLVLPKDSVLIVPEEEKNISDINNIKIVFYPKNITLDEAIFKQITEMKYTPIIIKPSEGWYSFMDEREYAQMPDHRWLANQLNMSADNHSASFWEKIEMVIGESGELLFRQQLNEMNAEEKTNYLHEKYLKKIEEIKSIKKELSSLKISSKEEKKVLAKVNNILNDLNSDFDERIKAINTAKVSIKKLKK